MRYSFILLFAVLISSLVFGQSIVVNPPGSPESSLTAEDLTKEVLISGGGCSEISDFSFKENPSQKFPAANRSWGYFQKGNSSFPFEEGIVLTSGYAKRTERTSGVIQSDGGFGWGGDPDASVLAGNRPTNNATVFEFDFTAYSDEISFNYVFASHEYPNFACQNYNDVFAFIISGPGITPDPGLSGKNIALLPNGDPVTINTVNDRICGDDEFYIAGPFSYIQHGGRTEVLTASSPVIPGQTYRIKLLVVDTMDTSYDSAVFLEAGSFNLGSAVTDTAGIEVQNGEIVCGASEYTLAANTPAPNPTYQWFFNGNLIPGATNQSYDATATGTYKVKIETPNCDSESEVYIEFQDPPLLNATHFEDLKCSTAGFYTFDLSDYENLISPLTDLAFTYYTSMNGAENELLADLIYDFQNYIVAEGVTTVYVRVQNEFGCHVVVPLILTVIEEIDSTPLIYALCDEGNDGEEVFDLESQRANMINGDIQDFIFEFYTDAALTDLIPNPEAYTNLSNPQVIYVKIYLTEDTQAICHMVETLTLELNEVPVVQPHEDLRCAIGGQYTFDLSDYESDISTSNNINFTYYTTLNGAEYALPADLINNFQTYTVAAGTTIVYVRVENDKGCFTIAELTLKVIEEADTHPVIYALCDEGNDGEEVFDLESQRANLINGDIQDFIFEFYSDAALTDLIPNPEAYLILSNPQVIYVKIHSVDDPNATCHVVETLTLELNEVPVVQPHEDLGCAIGGQYTFDLSDYESDISTSNNINFTYYTTLNGAENALPADLINNFQTYTVAAGTTIVYVRVENDKGCFSIAELTLKVIEEIDSTPLIYALCDEGNDGEEVFDLESQRANLINGDIQDFIFEFYTDAALTDLIPNPEAYTNLSNPQVIYVKIYLTEDPQAICHVVETLTLHVEEFPLLQDDTIDICDDLNEGSKSVDLRDHEIVITPGFDMTYQYFLGVGGPEILNPEDFEIVDAITEIQVLVKKQNFTHLDCEETRILTIVMHQAPIVSPEKAILQNCVLDATSTFHLPNANSDLVNDLNGVTFSYHFTFDEAFDNVNPLPFDYTNVSQLQIVYARFENALGCFNIGEIELSTVLQQQSIADAYQICENPYELFDNTEVFDLTSMEQTIEEALGGEDYDLSYFTTLDDALSGNNEIMDPSNYTNISNTQTIYVRAGIGPYHCAGIVDFTIEVLENPAMELIEELTYCANETSKKFLYKEGVFDTYTWYNSNGEIISNSSTVYFDQPGTYTLEVSMDHLPCPSRRDVEVKFSPSPVVNEVTVDGKTVTVIASGGSSPYSYSFDNGITWGDNHVWYNFPSGVHDVIVRSKEGCVSEPKTFGVLGITNFISPNGDGKNDVWEIDGLSAYPNTNLKIFDRYGKLFVDRNLNTGFRWDGTYLGRTVPSGDYWYIITLEDGRKITGHISVRASK